MEGLHLWKMRIVIWWQFLWLCMALPSLVLSEDDHVDTVTDCSGRFFDLSCHSDAGTVISIQWDATFFGRSNCSLNSHCCPQHTDCTVLVTQSEHAVMPHWLFLRVCNGQAHCTVQAVRSTICQSTDYETVTYKCVTADMDSADPTTESIKDTTSDTSTTVQTMATSSAAIRRPTEKTKKTTTQLDFGATHPDRTASSPTGEHDLTSTVIYKDTTIWSSTPLLGDGDTNAASNNVVIAVSVSLSLLLVLSVVVVAVVCYRRGLSVGSKRQLNPGNQTAPSAGDEEGIGDPQYENTTRAPSKVYETPGEVFAEPAPTYTALERQYENTGHLAQIGQTV